MNPARFWFNLCLLLLALAAPGRLVAQPDLESRLSRLEQRVASNEGAGMAVLVCAAFCALWAQNTGRNAWLWFFLGLLLSVIMLFVLLYKNACDRRSGRG